MHVAAFHILGRRVLDAELGDDWLQERLSTRTRVVSPCSWKRSACPPPLTLRTRYEVFRSSPMASGGDGEGGAVSSLRHQE
jgi:hypothetical protein